MNTVVRTCSVFVLALMFSMGCGPSKVATVNLATPELNEIDIKDPAKFLNDLKLSPYWKVEKRRHGGFRVCARSVVARNSPKRGPGLFLFEWVRKSEDRLPWNYAIRNAGSVRMEDGASVVGVEILFTSPRRRNISYRGDESTVALDIYDSDRDSITSSSLSELGIRLSRKHQIYLVLSERGGDEQRTATLSKLEVVAEELKSLANLPAKYRVEDEYRSFFDRVFRPPAEEVVVKRFPGIQDRDTFYGYARTRRGGNYEGVNVKISHPKYCGGEGTNPGIRQQKAECLGAFHYESDRLFFLIEDNAVYLKSQYNCYYGTFSGSGSFAGILEILDGDEKVLFSCTSRFKGWER